MLSCGNMKQFPLMWAIVEIANYQKCLLIKLPFRNFNQVIKPIYNNRPCICGHVHLSKVEIDSTCGNEEIVDMATCGQVRLIKDSFVNLS